MAEIGELVAANADTFNSALTSEMVNEENRKRYSDWVKSQKDNDD